MPDGRTSFLVDKVIYEQIKKFEAGDRKPQIVNGLPLVISLRCTTCGACWSAVPGAGRGEFNQTIEGIAVQCRGCGRTGELKEPL